MSASDKKKLRKELSAAKLTEKQKKERAEARKLRATTATFIIIMLVIVGVVIGFGWDRYAENSGRRDRKTIAAVVGTHQLNSLQMNYYLNDEVRNTYNQWSEAYGDSVALYASMMGVDVYSPISEQIYNQENGQTWGDFFLESALEKAKSDYALYDKAMAENFVLPAEDQAVFDSRVAQLDLYATYMGYKNADKYLKAVYGQGASKESYLEYYKIAATASAYYNQYRDSLTYDDAKIDAYEKDKYNNYSSFTYASYYVSASSYLKSSSTSEDGSTTYTDEDRATALAEADKIAKALATNTDVESLDKAIAALEINKDNKNAATTKNKDVMYTNVPTDTLKAWLSDEARTEGEIGIVVNETVSTDTEGKETKTTNGYYVVIFQGRNDNERYLANVRHILVSFEGGTLKSDGTKTYSDAEKATAKAEAERLMKLWQDGAATNDSFVELVKAHSKDEGSVSEGGLYEDIHAASSYVENFKNWAIDPERKANDVGVVESEYGYHVMYYVGDGELTYRDYMITEDMRAEDIEKWHEGLLSGVTVTKQDLHRLNLDLIMSQM